MRSMQQQLGVLGTISEFAYRQREIKKNYDNDGREDDDDNGHGGCGGGGCSGVDYAIGLLDENVLRIDLSD